MFYSGHQAFFPNIHVFLFKVATFLPNLVKIGIKQLELHQFSKFKMTTGHLSMPWTSFNSKSQHSYQI